MDEEQAGNTNSSPQFDSRWFKTYRSIVSFDLFAWLAIAGPFTDGEQREWDQLFEREDDEARKRMATLIATARERELGLALEERREPRLRYPAIAIDTVRQKIRELQRLSWEIAAEEQNSIVRRLYLDAIEEQLDARMAAALEAIWPLVDELFRTDAVVARLPGVAADPARLRAEVDDMLDAVLAAAGLDRPAAVPLAAVAGQAGRDGVHTEALGYVLAELQSVARAHPDATW